MALVFKRYFLKEIERIKYEDLVLELKPELNEIVFKLDDYELRHLVENMKETSLVSAAR